MAGRKYSLMMRSHARLTQPVGRAYPTLVRGLARAAAGGWPFDPAKAPASLYERETALLVVASLSRCFDRRVRCTANFAAREPDPPDEATADDWFLLEWRPTPADYAALVDRVLPRYLRAFRPYRATLGPEELMALDFDRERHRNDRYQVGRLHPVDYVGDGLCRTAFGRPAARCADRLRVGGVRADVVAGGLLVRLPGLLDVEQCDGVSAALHRLLGSGPTGSSIRADRRP